MTERVRVCPECGALYFATDEAHHAGWHAVREEALEAITDAVHRLIASVGGYN